MRYKIQCVSLEFLISRLAILLSLHFVPTRWMVGENVSLWVISQDSLHHLEFDVRNGIERSVINVFIPFLKSRSLWP
jgi:hypothetical protein